MAYHKVSSKHVNYVRRNASKLSYAQIAEKLDLSVPTVYKICKENGINKKQPPRKQKKLPTETVSFLKQNHAVMSLKELGAHFGVTDSCINNWLKSLGIKKGYCKPGPLSSKKTIDYDLAIEIRERWNKGHSVARISRDLNTAPHHTQTLVNTFDSVKTFEMFFDSPLSQEASYVLGFIIADGSIQERKGRKSVLSIGQADASILEEIRGAIKGGNITGTKGKWQYRVCSDYMVSRLREHGVKVNKTYKGISVGAEVTDEVFGSFLRGFFDGDGSISKNQGGSYTLTLGCVDHSFLLCIRDRVCDLIGHRGTLAMYVKKGDLKTDPYGNTTKATKDFWSLSYGVRTGLVELLSLMYDRDHISIERKRQKCFSCIEKYKRISS